MSSKQEVVFLVEYWLTGGGYQPAGVWWHDGDGYEFWYKPQFDQSAHHHGELGSMTQQLESHFASNDTIDTLAPLEVLRYYAERGGYKIQRAGPFRVEAEGRVDPQDLMEQVVAGQIKPIDSGGRVNGERTQEPEDGAA